MAPDALWVSVTYIQSPSGATAGLGFWGEYLLTSISVSEHWPRHPPTAGEQKGILGLTPRTPGCQTTRSSRWPCGDPSPLGAAFPQL